MVLLPPLPLPLPLPLPSPADAVLSFCDAPAELVHAPAACAPYSYQPCSGKADQVSLKMGSRGPADDFGSVSGRTGRSMSMSSNVRTIMGLSSSFTLQNEIAPFSCPIANMEPHGLHAIAVAGHKRSLQITSIGASGTGPGAPGSKRNWNVCNAALSRIEYKIAPPS